jgi:hypothetical protein
MEEQDSVELLVRDASRKIIVSRGNYTYEISNSTGILTIESNTLVALEKLQKRFPTINLTRRVNRSIMEIIDSCYPAESGN